MNLNYNALGVFSGDCIYGKSAIAHIMAWCSQAPCHYLKHLLTHWRLIWKIKSIVVLSGYQQPWFWQCSVKMYMYSSMGNDTISTACSMSVWGNDRKQKYIWFFFKNTNCTGRVNYIWILLVCTSPIQCNLTMCMHINFCLAASPNELSTAGSMGAS